MKRRGKARVSKEGKIGKDAGKGMMRVVEARDGKERYARGDKGRRSKG